MPEFFPPGGPKPQLSSTHLVISNCLQLSFFFLSHPLYFSYLIFFSPYLLKLFSYLSPLFITTSLLLLALLTISPGLFLPETKAVGSPLHAANQKESGEDHENVEFPAHSFEELEVYRLLFEASVFEVPPEAFESNSEENSSSSRHGGTDGAFASTLEGKSQRETNRVAAAPGITLEGLLQVKDVYEDVTGKVEGKERVEPTGAETNKVEEKTKEKPLIRSGSNALHSQITEIMAKVNADNGGEYTPKVVEDFVGINLGNDEQSDDMENSHKLCPDLESFRSMRTQSLGHQEYYTPKAEYSEKQCLILGSLGSTRKEKEWKRTLACKLFEERHNVEGGEGMDSLWETYETESNRGGGKSKVKKGKKGNRLEYGCSDDEEDGEADGQLCCLQALKFSAGKMNLGMGRPNLVKITKALKGIGWLHHVGRHGKKG
ncbi:uncharacterized protein LOC131155454 [Malania oleifera]|uniref:uncharacterized protein LOC131155454 n=1 Tax=Malania oleifera TaxID=397392 RepID=UPI0025ADAE68|nr:uncharacterized protein LOC131155454 [Malania oleifera]